MFLFSWLLGLTPREMGFIPTPVRSSTCLLANGREDGDECLSEFGMSELWGWAVLRGTRGSLSVSLRVALGVQGPGEPSSGCVCSSARDGGADAGLGGEESLELQAPAMGQSRGRCGSIWDYLEGREGCLGWRDSCSPVNTLEQVTGMWCKLQFPWCSGGAGSEGLYSPGGLQEGEEVCCQSCVPSGCVSL